MSEFENYLEKRIEALEGAPGGASALLPAVELEMNAPPPSLTIVWDTFYDAVGGVIGALPDSIGLTLTSGTTFQATERGRWLVEASGNAAADDTASIQLSVPVSGDPDGPSNAGWILGASGQLPGRYVTVARVVDLRPTDTFQVSFDVGTPTASPYTPFSYFVGKIARLG